MRAIFIHGAGRAGPQAWPAQAGPPWLPQGALPMAREDLAFVERIVPGDDPEVTVPAYAALLGNDPGHVVAHSYGAIAALLLAERHGAATLTLIEPAALSLSATAPATCAHIEVMATVYELASDVQVSDAEFFRRFSEALGSPAPPLPDEELSGMGAHLRALRPPWSVEVDPAVSTRVPTLVVTGAGEEMYGDVARVLTAHGAQHVEIPGTGHRPQDDERLSALLLQHWSGHSGS